MIVSHDTIIAVTPPFQITAKMLFLCTQVHRILGQYDGAQATAKPQPLLRKNNRIQTIQGSLAIEGNTLSTAQITALLDGKRVIGSKKEILEVQNCVQSYKHISEYKPFSASSFLSAHKIMMQELINDAGKWRKANVGVLQGKKIAHMAPQSKQVPELMKNLFSFMKKEKQIDDLIRSAIFHYELEFIHPFTDGNGRIGRLWQTVLLYHFHPIFEFTPIESIICERQKEYYKALGKSDKEGSSNSFIEFSLQTILDALKILTQDLRPVPLTAKDRLENARKKIGRKDFSRKEYLQIFKNISSATASRDLSFGIRQGFLAKKGEKNQTIYIFK